MPRESWASFATMHFRGNAALWLQSYEAGNEVDSWEELIVAIHSKFDKDKHHRYLDSLERCRQTDSVAGYYLQFEELRHKVLVHNKHYDEAFFVTKFVNGLKREIQKAINLHQPKTMNMALSLAEKQEELLEESRAYMASKFKHEYKKYGNNNMAHKGVLSTPAVDKKKFEEKPCGKINLSP